MQDSVERVDTPIRSVVNSDIQLGHVKHDGPGPLVGIGCESGLPCNDESIHNFLPPG